MPRNNNPRSGSTRQPKGPSQEQLDRERDWDGTKFKSTGTLIRKASTKNVNIDKEGNVTV